MPNNKPRGSAQEELRVADFDGTSRSPNKHRAHADTTGDAATPVHGRRTEQLSRPSNARSLSRKTIQTGVALAPPSESPASAALDPSHGGHAGHGGHGGHDASAVRQLPSAHVSSAAADGGGTTAEPEEPRRPRGERRAGRNAKLGRTLRMELKLGATPAADGLTADDPSGWQDSDRGAAYEPQSPLIFGSTRRIGSSPQTNEFMSARPALAGTNPMAPILASFEAPEVYNAHGPRTDLGSSRAGRKREGRRTERTLILTRRANHVKDWFFVVTLVGALGVTASMLLSYQSDTPEVSEEAAEEIAGASTQLPSAQLSAAQRTGVQPAAAQGQASSSSVRATELRSVPAGAEVGVGGAIVGNTPVRVARSDHDIDYVLRFPGYEPQVVRVGSQSPASIAVTLRRSGQ